MPEDSKSSFDLEPNPFERSFATKESTVSNTPSEPKDGDKGLSNGLTIPTLSHFDQTNGKLPTITPTLFTPGGRRLPPLGLSPGGNMANPETPGTNLWNSLLSATNNPTTTLPQDPNEHTQASSAFHQNNPSFHHFVNNMKKSGLTPNESNLRSGLTPGGINGSFQFVPQVSGLTTPGALLNNGMMSGFSNISGIPAPSNSTNVPAQDFPSMNRSIPKSVDNRDSKPTSDTVIERKESNKRKDVETEVITKKRKTESTQKTKKLATKKEFDSADTKKSSKRLADNDKRKNFLERNRVAASKCRQRKKQLTQKMEDELAYYSTGYRELSSQVTQLRDQLVNVRGILIGHKDCPMLSNQVGGYDQLHNLIQQINYVTQLTSRNQSNPTSIPSTIPTTLNNPHDNGANIGYHVNSNSNISSMMSLPMNSVNSQNSSNSPHASSTVNTSGIKFASSTPDSISHQQGQTRIQIPPQTEAHTQVQTISHSQSQSQTQPSTLTQQQPQQQQQPQPLQQQAQQQRTQHGTKQHAQPQLENQSLPVQTSHRVLANQLTQHDSLTNLPVAAATANLGESHYPSSTSTGNGDLRLINSMSNIAVLNNNTSDGQQVSNNNMNTYNLRPVNSMVDLSSQQALSSQPHSSFTNDMNLIAIGRQQT